MRKGEHALTTTAAPSFNLIEENKADHNEAQNTKQMLADTLRNESVGDLLTELHVSELQTP